MKTEDVFLEHCCIPIMNNFWAACPNSKFSFNDQLAEHLIRSFLSVVIELGQYYKELDCEVTHLNLWSSPGTGFSNDFRTFSWTRQAMSYEVAPRLLDLTFSGTDKYTRFYKGGLWSFCIWFMQHFIFRVLTSSQPSQRACIINTHK